MKKIGAAVCLFRMGRVRRVKEKIRSGVSQGRFRGRPRFQGKLAPDSAGKNGLLDMFGGKNVRTFIEKRELPSHLKKESHEIQEKKSKNPKLRKR